MISFVYFDLGGVVIKDFSGTDKWTEMKKMIGVKEGFEKEFDELYDKYELSELCLTRDVDTLIPIFAKKFGMSFPRDFSILSYFVDHFERNTSIWPVIKKMHKTCKVGLLTNMYPSMFKAIQKRGLLPPVKWDVLIDSSVVGLQKPDRRIFTLAEERSLAKHDEILFVDDRKVNIGAAKRFGWQTFLYNPSNHKESILELTRFLFD